MSKLLPYETIVKAHEGDPDAIDTVLVTGKPPVPTLNP